MLNFQDKFFGQGSLTLCFFFVFCLFFFLLIATEFFVPITQNKCATYSSATSQSHTLPWTPVSKCIRNQKKKDSVNEPLFSCCRIVVSNFDTMHINKKFTMSSKRSGVFSCFVISLILTILHTAWPILNRTEEASVVLNEWYNKWYYNHQYKTLIYPKHIPDTYLDMVMFIPSQHRDTSFQRRQFLRKKMLNSTFFPQVKIRHIFVFGEF